MNNNYDINIKILEDMKKSNEEFEEKRKALLERERKINETISNDGFDEIMKELGIF